MLRRLGLWRLVDVGRSVLSRLVDDRVVIIVGGTPLEGGVEHLRHLSQIAEGTYEPATLELFGALIEPGATVIDIGAGIGLFTVLAAGLAGPTGRVIAFEPDPRSLRHLRANVRRAGLANVEIVEAAAAASHGVAWFYAAAVPSRSTLEEGVFTRSPLDRTVEVATVLVDDVIAGAHVDVVKMDVEGGEPAALEGMRATLDSNPSLHLIVEFEPETLAAGQVTADEFLAALRVRFPAVLAIDEADPSLVDIEDWIMQRSQNLYCGPTRPTGLRLRLEH